MTGRVISILENFFPEYAVFSEEYIGMMKLYYTISLLELRPGVFILLCANECGEHFFFGSPVDIRHEVLNPELLSLLPGGALVYNLTPADIGKADFPSAGFKTEIIDYEFLYSRESLLTRSGSAYKKKRNDFTHFTAICSPGVEEYYNPADFFSAAGEFIAQQEITAAGACDKNLTLRSYCRMLERLLNGGFCRKFFGIIVRVRGQIAGISFGFYKNNLFVNAGEYFRKDKRGAGAFIFFSLAEKVNARLINTMGCGLDNNLKASKQSFNPKALPLYRLIVG